MVASRLWVRHVTGLLIAQAEDVSCCGSLYACILEFLSSGNQGWGGWDACPGFALRYGSGLAWAVCLPPRGREVPCKWGFTEVNILRAIMFSWCCPLRKKMASLEWMENFFWCILIIAGNTFAWTANRFLGFWAGKKDCCFTRGQDTWGLLSPGSVGEWFHHIQKNSLSHNTR